MRQDFCNLESKRIWESIAKDAQTIKAANGGSSLQPVISNNAAITTSADALTDIFVSKQEFIEVLRNKASSVDLKRTWPITSSMILIGASVGVITPAMPFVVEQMGLNASEYGLIVSAFGLARMLGNVPSAVAIEKWGRRPFMIHSLSLIALGVGGIGWASTFEELYLCRLMTGVGVSLLGGAATLMVTDISTPLNRASTMAPVMSGFTAGTALGPAMGGVMVDSIGLAPTFYLVGASYLGVAAVNRAVLSETQRRPMKFAWRKKPTEPVANADDTLSGAVQNAVGQWAPLLKQRSVQSIMVMNASYWLALAGAQMTIMPLILTDQAGLNLSATELGQVYMGMSLIQIVGNPVFAKFIDKIGKAPAIVTGCTLISLPMAAMPLCQDWMQLAGVCGLWACGSSMMSTAPLAYMSDKVAESERAQSIALLRTCGDMGFLVGASAIGALADWAGSLDHGMQTSAGLLLTATAWFGARQLIFVQPDTSRNPKGEKIDDNTKSP
uniref:Major facilitator superfamily (MFS) profile domain-containing protein n=1 Tax=Entomoneis paludosa TaxID=265537 RepID=A0A7S3DXK2_9STRA